MDTNATQMLSNLMGRYLDEAGLTGNYRAAVLGECMTAGTSAYLAAPDPQQGRCDAQDAAVRMLDFMLDPEAKV